MADAIKQLLEGRLLPLVRFDRAADAIPLAKALYQAGLLCLAVTVRSAGWRQGVAAIKEQLPEMTLGVADICDSRQIDDVAGCGADFILSPIVREDMMVAGSQADIPVIPGCCTPTEIDMALSRGAELINFFPAEAVGGVRTLVGISGPFDNARFLVSNGVDMSNLKSYLSCPKVLVCGVKWFCSPELVNARAFAEIENKARRAVEAVAKI